MLAILGNRRNQILLTIAIAIFCGLIVLSTFGRRRAGRTCRENLRIISAAMATYADEHGCFPPVFVGDMDSEPRHSWRVLLLPYIERVVPGGMPEITEFIESYDLAKPWNSRQNIRLATRMPSIYSCPDDPGKKTLTTSYVMISGRQCIGDPNGCVIVSSIIDGLPTTILVAELVDSGIHWTEPRDLSFTGMSFDINDPVARGLGSNHRWAGANVVMADGTVRFLGNKTPSHVVRAIATRNGGEPVSMEDF